ncbi:MAG: RNA methyltransferase [Planctomycetota bacterium]|nr:RNA methyltransferase [Planctomycetota bacterium]
MPVIPIDTLDDPRVAHYRSLKDRELAAEGGRFIAEGEHLVRRLLASDFPCESVLMANRRAAELAPQVRGDIPVYTLPDELLEGVIGFAFHSGVMAVGLRKPNPSLESILGPPGIPSPKPITLVICPEIINADNLGSLIRISSAFGAAAMLVGERSCDPFWRRSVRVSMGTIFSLPILLCDDLLPVLRDLRTRWGVEMVATVTDAGAQPLERAQRPGPPNRLGLLLGSESQGLHGRWLTECDRHVTIPMHLGTDSLNVAVAAAVFLYHFTRTQNPSA